jgi:hypothetical protein
LQFGFVEQRQYVFHMALNNAYRRTIGTMRGAAVTTYLKTRVNLKNLVRTSALNIQRRLGWR